MKILRRIHTILQTPGLLYTVINNIKKQRKFIKENILLKLEASKNTADGSLDDNDFKKITDYYGLAVPAVLGEAFCALRGRNMTAKERMASTCQGAMTGLGDDFFDKQRLTDEAVKDLIEDPQNFPVSTAGEKLFLQTYTTALANAPLAKSMQEQLYKVYQAQLLSKKQGKRELGLEAIKDITLRKGAESLLFYRSSFNHPLIDQENKILWCLGGLMQLSNDIFDVYEDQQNGIDTLMTTTKNISDIRMLFLSLLHIGYESATKTNYPRSNIKKFLNILSISIFSRSLVCLEQLERNEKRSNNVFVPGKYKRKDLVCDMDTAVNKWRSVRYHIKYAL